MCGVMTPASYSLFKGTSLRSGKNEFFVSHILFFLIIFRFVLAYIRILVEPLEVFIANIGSSFLNYLSFLPFLLSN